MQRVYLTVDLGFGDAGKGSIVDFLSRRDDAHTVVRYNGGAQAGHRVVTAGANPREHIFAQFGSGTLAGAATHLSRFMLLDPLAMMQEGEQLLNLGVDAFQQTTIDERALVITPFQRAANRLKELARGAGRHGSCGMGIGETMADFLQYGDRVLFAGDLAHPGTMRVKLQFLRMANLEKVRALPPGTHAGEQVALEQEPLIDDGWIEWLVETYSDFSRRARIVPRSYLSGVLERPGTVIFEGAQGVLLDEWNGFHPHTTWSTTTLEYAERLLRESGYRGEVTRIGITRAYATRHGAGPLVTEDAALTRALPDVGNTFGTWQRGFRVGWLDLVMLDYALGTVGALDMLAVTCLDRLAELPGLQICRRYRHGQDIVARLTRSPVPCSLAHQEQLTRKLADCRPVLEPVANVSTLLDLIEGLGVPIGIMSTGPRAADKHCLRHDAERRYRALRRAAEGQSLQPLAA